MARCLNCAVLGKDRQRDQRNTLTVEEAKNLFEVANNFVSAVKHRFIRNMDDAKRFFKEVYYERFLTNLPFTDCKVID